MAIKNNRDYLLGLAVEKLKDEYFDLSVIEAGVDGVLGAGLEFENETEFVGDVASYIDYVILEELV